LYKIIALLLFSFQTFAQVTPLDSSNIIDMHNKARKEVGVGPLAWSAELSNYAQQWADYLSSKPKIFHSKCVDFNGRAIGENIYWSSSYEIHNITDAFRAWYDEKNQYTYSKIKARNSRNMSGHYTQIVWRDTKEVGAGIARTPSGGLVVVTSYYPAGNIIDELPY
jgi:hypothetical protein